MNRHVYYTKRMQTIYDIGSRYLDVNTLHTQAKSLSILNYIYRSVSIICENWIFIYSDSWQFALIITYVPNMPPLAMPLYYLFQFYI